MLFPDTPRVALSGGAWYGKSTLAQRLQNTYQYYHVDAALEIKMVAATMLRAGGVMVSVNDILNNKQRFRPFLQEVGKLMGIDEGTEFVRRFVDPALPLSFGHPIVVEPIRTQSQAHALRRAGFKIVSFKVSNTLRRERARSLGVSDADYQRTIEHPLEQQLPRHLVDYELPGGMNVDDQADVLTTWLKRTK